MVFYCASCKKEFVNISSLHAHEEICIYYNYHKKHNSYISNELINEIAFMLNAFELHKIEKHNESLDKRKLMKSIATKYKINHNSMYILLYGMLLEYDDNIKYSEILQIISFMVKVSINDILNVVSAYIDCYSTISNYIT